MSCYHSEAPGASWSVLGHRDGTGTPPPLPKQVERVYGAQEHGRSRLHTPKRCKSVGLNPMTQDKQSEQVVGELKSVELTGPRPGGQQCICGREIGFLGLLYCLFGSFGYNGVGR